MNIKKHDNTAIDLANESFGNYSAEYTFEEALSNGVLVNVTSWVRHEMGFGENRYRVEVAVTARLIDAARDAFFPVLFFSYRKL